MQYLPVIQWGRSFIDKIDLENCQRVLEIGCRQGALSRSLADDYPQVKFTAIDNLPSEINKANDTHAINVSYEIADALELEFLDHFDAVVSFSCLHWIQNKLKVLQNIHDTLRPGGKAYLQFFARHHREKNDRFLYQVAYSPRWKNYFKRFTPGYTEIGIGELSDLLQATGFIIHKLEFITYETIFEHVDSLSRWLESWASHKNRVPKPNQEQFLQEASQLYLKYHHYNGQDSFPYHEHVLEVVCEKRSQNDLPTDQPCYQYGHVIFTPKEIAVLRYFLQGKSAKEIARITCVSSKAIEFHLANVKNKLNCHRRSEIYQAAISKGFINLMFG